MKIKTLSQACVGGLTTIGAFALPTSVIAQDYLGRYDSCAQLADDAARLACFDRTYKEESETRVARAEAERARRADQFGFSATQINRGEADAMAEAETSRDPVRIAAAEDTAEQRHEEQVEVVNEVADVFTDGARRTVVLLGNGQLWRETSNRTLRGEPRTGWTATVRQIWSGGYRMTFEERSGFLGVDRVR